MRENSYTYFTFTLSLHHPSTPFQCRMEMVHVFIGGRFHVISLECKVQGAYRINLHYFHLYCELIFFSLDRFVIESVIKILIQPKLG